MKGSIFRYLARRRSARDWCAIVLVGIAIAVELVDAAFGINGIASTSDFAASNVVDIADVMIGGAAAWLLHA